MVDEAFGGDHVQEREREGRIAARERLQVQIGRLLRRRPHRVDHDYAGGRLGQPVTLCVRRRGGGVRAANEDAAGVARDPRIEADLRAAVHVVEGDVPGLVAARVWIDLRRAEPLEEAQR